MPLYIKAKNLTDQDIEKMSFDECYELLLIFRYLQFREDTTLDNETIALRMEQLRNRMQELNENTNHFKNFM